MCFLIRRLYWHGCGRVYRKIRAAEFLYDALWWHGSDFLQETGALQRLQPLEYQNLSECEQSDQQQEVKIAVDSHNEVLGR